MSNFHQHSFVFDAHCDTLMAGTPGPQYRDLLQWGSTGHLDLPRLRAAGINCQVFACFPGRTRLNACATSAVLERIQVLYGWMERAPGQFLLVRTAADLASLTSDGPIGAILGLEGSEALAGSLSLLRIFHRLGVRNIGLTWDRRTAAADGVRVGSKAGLSDFGRELVKACNRLGIMIDISHLNAAGIDDVLELSSKPIIASHSNAYAICPHPRNLSDEQLRKIAETGSVVGVTFVDDYLDTNPAAANLERLLDHIDHIVQVAGIDHVGIGSDFDGCIPIAELDSGEKYPAISAGLARRGYTATQIQQIIGENFRRVFSLVLP